MFTDSKSRSHLVYITYSTGTDRGFRSAKSGDLSLERAVASEAIVARFWRFVQRESGTNGCWIWTGSAVGKAQHGQFALAHNVNRYAHRFSWALHCGPIPDGLNVCHRCDVPRGVSIPPTCSSAPKRTTSRMRGRRGGIVAPVACSTARVRRARRTRSRRTATRTSRVSRASWRAAGSDMPRILPANPLPQQAHSLAVKKVAHDAR